MEKRAFIRQTTLGVCGLLLGLHRRAGGWGSEPGRDADEPGKHSIEARFYDRTPDGIKCRKCPHECLLAEGETGICRNRIVWRGTLYSIAYGNACAVHIDPIEKKPLYHFLPGTTAFSIAAAGCNLRCLNCQNWQISQVSPRETSNIDLMPPRVVEEARAGTCRSIAYTYSEPTTFFEYAYDTAEIAHARGIRNVWKSNGFICEAPLRKLFQVIDAANIDLKSFDPAIYRKLNGADLAPVLRTLKIFHEEGVWLEITNLVIPSWTDDLSMIGKMCDWLVANGLQDCPLHFSRFTPLYKLSQLPMTSVSTLDRARDIALRAGMRYVYVGNVPGHAAESTFCPHCGATVIHRRGYVVDAKGLKNGACASCGTTIAGRWETVVN